MNHFSAPCAQSPLTAAFLRRIADPPSANGASGYAYAESVILPSVKWPREEFMERLLLDLAQPGVQRAIEQAEKKFGKGDYAPFSFALTAKGGDSVFFLALPRPGLDADGRLEAVLALAAQPATPVRKPDLFGRDGAVFKVLDVLPAYVLLIDQSNVIHFGNRAARQLFGRVDGRKCHEALHGLDSPCATCSPFSVFFTNRIKVHDWACVKTSTAFRAYSYPFEAADGKSYVLQVGLNITADIRARHALGLSEQRYRTIAENLTMGLALADAELNVLTVNPRMEKWFGSVAKGARIRDVLQNPLCDCVFDDVLADKKNHETEFRAPLASGEERQFRLIACPILVRSERLRAVVIMIEDVTDRRNMAARLQQMQRLESLGSLAGGIAHEINQPLSALHLYAGGMQMLLEQGASTPPELILERLALILAQADKIKQIISHMRALVLQEENPPAVAVNVAEAATAALGLVGAQLREHGVAVTVDIPEDLPLASANHVQLEQVVINLLVNAMHALDSVQDQGKIIRLTAGREAASGLLFLRVTDNGPGVGDLRFRIFDPFFTTKESQRGMGLGLSIVHALVSSWGGSVEAADNADGPGAAFTVLLPVAAPGGDVFGAMPSF